MNIIDLEIERIRSRIAANKRQHKPVVHLHELAHELRLAQLRGECREDWLELARHEYNRRYHEENGIDPDTRGHGSQCGDELGQDVRSQR